MFLIALFLTFPLSSYAAKMNKEFACFSAMNQSSRTEDVVLNDKVAIHPIDGYSFFMVTGDSIQKCRVPAKANLAPEGREGAGPWLVKLTHNKVPYHIQYPQVREHLDLKGSPAWAKPECTGASDGKSVGKILDNRVNESRMMCVPGPRYGDCLADFLVRLQSCEGIPAIKHYVKELAQSARAHATPATGGASAPQTGR